MTQLLEIPEVAKRLAVPVKAVRLMIGRGEIPALKLSERRTRVPEDGLEMFLKRKLGRC